MRTETSIKILVRGIRTIALVLVYLLYANLVEGQSGYSPATILDISWHPQGGLYAQVDASGNLQVLNAITHDTVFQFSPDSLDLLFAQVTWNSTGTQLAAGIGNRVYLWNTSNWELVGNFLAGDPDGQTYDEGFGTVTDAIISIAWAQDDNRLATASLSRIGVWDTNTAGSIYNISTANLFPVIWVQNDALLTNGFATLNPNSGEIISLNTITYADKGALSSSELTANHSVLANSTHNGYIEILDAVNLQSIAIIHAAPGFVTRSDGGIRARIISDIAWNSSGDFLAAVTRDGEILVVNVATQEVETASTVPGQLFAVDWNPTTNEVIYGGVSSTGEAILATVDVNGIAGVQPAAVVTHTDPSLVITDEGNYVAEGTTVGDRFGLSLTTQPTADVVATFTTSDPGQLLMSPPGSGAWGMAPTYSVTYSLDGREGTGLWSRMTIINLHGVPDEIAEPPQTYTITITLSSADPRFNNVTLSEEVTVYDAGVSITPTAVTLDEGTSSTYEVVLTAPPGFIAAYEYQGGLQAEVVQVSVTSSNPTDLEALASPLTFTRANWNVPQVVTLNALQPGSYTVTHEVSSSITINPYMDSRYGGSGTNVTLPSVSVTVNEVVPPLSAPVLLSPLDTVTVRTPQFSWEPVSEATNYVLHIERGDGTEFYDYAYVSNVCDSTLCAATPVIFLQQGVYQWRVQASTSPENQSPWSNNEEFFADVGITLSVPTPLIPVNVAIASGSWRAAPFFTWSVVPGTTEYRLRIDNLVTGQPLFEQSFPASNCNEQTCSVTLNDVGIQVGLYGWQVQAAAPDGAESPWSARAVFLYFGPT